MTTYADKLREITNSNIKPIVDPCSKLNPDEHERLMQNWFLSILESCEIAAYNGKSQYTIKSFDSQEEIDWIIEHAKKYGLKVRQDIYFVGVDDWKDQLILEW